MPEVIISLGSGIRQGASVVGRVRYEAQGNGRSPGNMEVLGAVLTWR